MAVNYEVSIRELVDVIGAVAENRDFKVEYMEDFKGELPQDVCDRAERRLMDTNKIRGIGWSPQIGLLAGIVDTFEWYQKHHGKN